MGPTHVRSDPVHTCHVSKNHWTTFTRKNTCWQFASVRSTHPLVLLQIRWRFRKSSEIEAHLYLRNPYSKARFKIPFSVTQFLPPPCEERVREQSDDDLFLLLLRSSSSFSLPLRRREIHVTARNPTSAVRFLFSGHRPPPRVHAERGPR